MKITMENPHTAEELAAMCGGILYQWGDAPIPPVTGICTDSREADGATAFCAIRGERVDGHGFLPAVYGAGCPLAFVERMPDAPTLSERGEGAAATMAAAAIVVDDTVAALSRLAAARRKADLADMKTVAVTGSVGKTTTKEMVAAVLAVGSRGTGRAFKKDGNFNSVIGLPLSVMEIPADTTHAVLEMGMSGRGEIAAMSAAARPDIALITNIGSSHLALLGTRENIAAAKLEIAEGLRPGGILLLCGDEPLLAAVGHEEHPLRADIRVLRLSLAGAPEADFAAERITATDAGMRFDLHTPDGVITDLLVPAPGRHMVWAGAFAAAVGTLCGFSDERIREGLAAYRPAALRQNCRRVGQVTFMEDCYNAAPESMRAAFEVLDITAAHAPTPARRIAVLGSMLELGEQTVEHHREVGRTLAAHRPDLLVTVGELGAHIAAGARDGGLPADRILTFCTEATPATLAPATDYPPVAAALAERILPGDIILYKASRSMKMEEIAHTLETLLTE